ncbi:MAG: lipid II:glycine glycyltransferase FemX [Thermodesulfobacteriota bacterium]
MCTDIGGIALPPKIREVDPHDAKHDPNLFQSPFWAHFRQARGYPTQAFQIEHQGQKACMILIHRPCSGHAGFGHIPYGADIPLPEEGQGPFLDAVSEQIRHCLPPQCLFLRYDLPWPSPYAPQDGSKADWEGPPEPRIRELRMNFGSKYWRLRKAPTDMQPPDTVVLDLSRPASDILRDMHGKNRYCLRRALRQGVAVHEAGPEALPLWYPLYRDMTRRKRIATEGLAYFQDLFSVARGHTTDVALYLGFQNGRLLAGCIIAFHDDTATYLYSAASPEGRALMASYPVLWKAVLHAKLRGCRWFDLYGIPPGHEPNHPMHGLYRFKTRFGGHILHMRGCWDYPFDEKRYSNLAFAAVNHTPYHA